MARCNSFCLIRMEKKYICGLNCLCIFWLERTIWIQTDKWKDRKKKFLRSSELMCNIGGVTLRHIHNVSIIIKQYSLRNKRMNGMLLSNTKTFTTEALRINIPKIGFCHFIDVYLVCVFRLQYNLQICYAMRFLCFSISERPE